MTRVTTAFRIRGPVPFVNVHVDCDNLLFLDPSAIRNDPDPLARRAHNQLLSFFGEVLRCRLSASPADHARGLALLQELHEPNETRLGMSVAGVQGHGWDAELGERLWEELAINAACRTAALTRLEDLSLFIDRVGADLVSDMTTRVIYDVLTDFTQQMILTYPALGRTVTTVHTRVWNPAAAAWVIAAVSLPDVPPHPLLLVPKRWVFWRLLMNHGAFYNRFATSTVKEERATYDQRTGRRIAPTKKQLNEEFRDLKALNNRQAVKYMRSSRDLVAEYRAQVDSEFEPLDDDQLDARTEG